MWAIAILAMMSSLMIGVMGSTEALQRDLSPQTLRLKAEAGKVAAFKQVANLYIAANPTATGAITWSAISTTPGLPLGLAGASIPSNWKIVADGNMGYTICADVSAGAAYYLRETMEIAPSVNVHSAGGGKFVLARQASDAAVEASKC